MSRGESSGGGQSSLGYLFGSEEQPSQAQATKTVPLPPYGIDMIDNTMPHNGVAPSITQLVVSNNRSHGQHLGNIVTDRPSTKVKSVPGEHSSLGYLFGDKGYVFLSPTLIDDMVLLKRRIDTYCSHICLGFE